MLLKKLLTKFPNFPAYGMSISLETQDLSDMDTVIFQEVTKITFYWAKYGSNYIHTFCKNLSGFNST